MNDEQDLTDVVAMLRSIRATLYWTLGVLVVLVTLLALWLLGVADLIPQVEPVLEP